MDLSFSLAVIFACAVSLAVCDTCTNHVTTCIEPIKDPRLLPKDSATLDDLCNKFNVASTCMSKAPCSADNEEHVNFVKGKWHGLRDSSKYLCEEKKQAYLKHATCLSERSKSREIETCKNDATPLNIEKTNMTASCKKSNTLMDCVFGAVNKTCGEEAAILYRMYTFKNTVHTVQVLYKDCAYKQPSATAAAASALLYQIFLLLAAMLSAALLV